METAAAAKELLKDLILPAEGAGPLLQRDYWAVIENCGLTPTELAALVGRDFCSFAPEELVRFDRGEPNPGGLTVGDEIDVKIRMAGSCRVRVLHRDRNSVTLATLRGHPEAGRITFGSYRSAEGEVIFHIRSRAKSSSSALYAAYRAAGEPMQTNTWTDFIDKVAHTAGTGVQGAIHVETTELPDDFEGPEAVSTPTFLAVGD